jgi:murein DD-endopeptidase MepM/ murein hydrolase activator NlpD
MKKHFFVVATFILFATLSFSFLNRATSSTEPQTPFIQADGGGTIPLPTDYISDEQRREIQRQNQTNIERLEREGKLPKANPEIVVALNWPLRKAVGVTDFDVWGISNYVDHNFAFPNQVRDYNCGTRTYDTSGGYNHQGVDIFTWPFWWHKVDTNGVEVVAAAPGTIINKFNGNFDRNCSLSGGNWNAVYVRHADNSIAWYGHLKNNSLTSKNIGETVAEGEYLGIVGSSGNSTGPHLHFELYNASNQLQDPYQGACNLMNNFTWWASQKPYNNPNVNKLQTHTAPPVFPLCPNTETINAVEFFRPGRVDAIFAAYYRDQQNGMVTNYSILRPDGTTHQAWNHSPTASYQLSYWYWNINFPLSASSGQWKFRAVFNGQTSEKTFTILRSPFDFDGDNKTDISIFRPSVGQWWYQQSSNNTVPAYTFGTTTDKIVPGDYDGDSKTDIAFFRPSTGEWYVLRSSNLTFFAAPFGNSTDSVAPGDYDGDGKTDLTVFRSSQGVWFINQSSGGIQAIPFGTNGDIPAVADYDGDGKTDIAIFRPTGGSGNGEWWMLRSRDGLFATPFGSATDKPVQGDYTGDGKADIAFFRPATANWFILRSEDLSFYAAPFGASTDTVVPGDYDGDGKFDLAVFRPSNVTWFINKSSGGTQIQTFGSAGDKPVPSAFVP